MGILEEETLKVDVLGELGERYMNVNVEEVGGVFDNVMWKIVK